MSIIMYKQRFKPPNDYHTPKLNYLHIGYIATRPRSMKNEFGEHALFGYLSPEESCSDKPWQETAKYIRKLSEKKINIYRSIISFDRENANEIGLRTQKDWQTYTENHIRMISEKNGISIENLGFCGAFHNEGKHPHVHIVFWDKSQRVMKNYTSPKIPNDIRVSLIKETFAEKIKDFYERKKNAKIRLGDVSNEMVADFDKYMKNVYPKEFKAIKAQFETYDDADSKIQILQLFNSDKQLADFAEKLFKIRAMLPKGGRISYKLLPTYAKAEVDTLTDYILKNNTYLQNAIKQYVDIQCEIKKLYQSDHDKMDDYRAKCETEAKKIIGNKILKSVKVIISKEFEVRNAEYTVSQKKYFAMECMRKILDFFARGIVADNGRLHDMKDRTYGDLSELAMKEWYEKNKDKGLEF